jgi:hypothetical protein
MEDTVLHGDSRALDDIEDTVLYVGSRALDDIEDTYYTETVEPGIFHLI